MALRISFYLDEHAAHAIARALGRRGVDVLTTHDAGRLGAEDRAHLTFAAEQDRVLFTQDDDFLRLAAQGVEDTGIAYVQQGVSLGRIVQGLTLIHDVLEPRDMRNHVEFL